MSAGLHLGQPEARLRIYPINVTHTIHGTLFFIIGSGQLAHLHTCGYATAAP